MTICSGETFKWSVNGTDYTQAGTYTVTNNGCTADQELVLTVTPKPTTVSTPITICSGASYTWDVTGLAYTTAGTFTKTNDGCTADQELVLTVTPKPTTVSTPITICSGASYTWDVTGLAYTTAGTFTKTNDGCTADQELVLTVTPKPTTVSTPITICSGASYTWDVTGLEYTTAGTFTKTNDGCTADQELVLTVTPKPTTVSTPITICSGASYTWDVTGLAYTTAGTFTKTNDGCTADQELVLTVTPKPTTVSTPITICSGASYTWDVTGLEYTTAGTFTKTNDGCTADQELVLTVTPKPTTVSTPITICSGASYTWDVTGLEYTTAGTFTKTNDGCTADQELVLTVTPKPTTVSTPITICSGETYNWEANGTAYTVQGTYTKVNSGCTADQELVLIVKTPVIVNSTACNTDSTLTIDLATLLPQGTPLNGTWIDSNNTGAISGSLFSPLGVSTGIYDFQYKIDTDNCSSNFTVKMNVSDEDCGIVLGCGIIEIHNAFSPNGDGINEQFVIDNIDDTNCYPDNTVEIYNRWGVLVYETTGYNNTSKAFKGISQGRTTISQSSGLPSGTYFYILNYTSFDGNGKIQTNKKNGYLYLTR